MRLYSGELRKLQTAGGRRGIPPLWSLNDATLLELAQFKPLTEADLLTINGVGYRKLRNVLAVLWNVSANMPIW